MQTLFYGGNILTMQEPLYTQAVLVEDGIIKAIGTEEELRSKAHGCEEVDLNGATLMPGFIDAHSHFFNVATAMLQVSLNGADSAEEITKRISEFIKENNIKPGQWVNARDYDNNIMPDFKNPTLSQLDSFAPNNPLVIHHKSGHMGLMNTSAINLLGITADTPAPAGGRIEIESGKLTGYFEENAFIESIKKIPLPDTEQLLQGFKKAQEKYASYGITTIQDGMVVKEMLPLYDLLLQNKLLNLDVMLYPCPDDYDLTLKKYGSLSPDKHLFVSGMKIFLDGSPQGCTAWMRKPYKNEETYCGYGTMTDENVEASFELAAQKNAQLIAHCNGDAAAEQFLCCLEKAEEKYPNLKELRPVIIHGQLIGLDQLPRVAKLKAMISFFVAHIYHWGDVHLRNFGKDKASLISPTNSALKEGIKFTFHQDAPVIEPDMIETVWCAVNRVTKKGVQLESKEQLSVLEALKAVTINGAYQYFKEDTIGSIAIGKHADFAVLDRNPLETPKDEIREIKILNTYKNGNCIYSNA